MCSTMSLTRPLLFILFLLSLFLNARLVVAWSLPAPLQRSLASNKRWYQDIGSAVDRHVVYNDNELFLDDDDYDSLSLGFARLSVLEDDTHHYFPSDAVHDHAPTTRRRRPLRAFRGVWKRVRRNKAY